MVLMTVVVKIKQFLVVLMTALIKIKQFLVVMTALVKIKQFLVVMTAVVKIKQFLVVMTVVVKIKQFLVVMTVVVKIIRYGDYGLRTTVGRKIFLLWSTGPSTQRVARKYEVKIADYRQRTTNKARSKLQEKLASLFIYILRPECLFEKVEMPMFSL